MEQEALPSPAGASSSSSAAPNAPRKRQAPWLPPAWFFRGFVVIVVAAYWVGCNIFLLRWLGLTSFGGLLIIFSFNFLIFMTMWSYYSASYTDPGSPPKEWEPTADIVYGLPSTSSTDGTNPQYRHCIKCDLPKPPRTHHCSICNRCVLKMDHHCPWVANCVGHKNHKSFLLFLFYSTFAAIAMFVLVAIRFVNYVKIVDMKARDYYMPQDQFVSMMILGALLIPGIFAVLPLFCFHIWLAFTNMTTIEMSQYDRFQRAMRISGSPARLKRLRYPFDHGLKINTRSFFGSSIWSWFVPGEAPGDGMNWQVREDFSQVMSVHEKHVKEMAQLAEQKRAKQRQQKPDIVDDEDDAEASNKGRIRANAEMARLV